MYITSYITTIQTIILQQYRSFSTLSHSAYCVDNHHCTNTEHCTYTIGLKAKLCTCWSFAWIEGLDNGWLFTLKSSHQKVKNTWVCLVFNLGYSWLPVVGFFQRTHPPVEKFRPPSLQSVSLHQPHCLALNTSVGSLAQTEYKINKMWPHLKKNSTIAT